MASTFPAAIANEPPPLDISSEDEDSEEYRSHGLKLDVPSGEPTPVSTPYKRPINKSPDKIKLAEIETSNEELIVSVSPESSQSSTDEAVSVDPAATETPSPEKVEKQVNGIEQNADKVETESIDNEDDWHDAPLQEELQEEQENEKVTDYCDSGTNVNCTNSNVSQSWQRDADDGLMQTENIAQSSVRCDEDEFVNEVSEKLEEPSRNEGDSIKNAEADTCGEPDQISEGNPTIPTSPVNKVVDETSAEFLDFQTSDKDTTSTSNQETVGSDVQDHVESEALNRPDETNLGKNHEDDDFDDDDFGAFQSIPQPTIQQSQSLVKTNEEDNDDFGDFAQNSVQIPSTRSVPPATNQLLGQTSQDNIEEFADFQDCSFQSSDGTSSVQSPFATSGVTPITSKIDSIIKTLFVIEPNSCDDEASKPNSIDSEIGESSDSTWARVQDFEGSHALMFKWLGSLTGKRLLRSLNINTTNIVYHEKWGTIEVPKFAASLVQSPLQPQSCNKLESQSKSDEHPAIVNNNTILSDDRDKPASLSTEAQEILRQLPDLSYMRANTLVFPQTSPSGL